MKKLNADAADCYDLLIRRGGSENHHYLIPIAIGTVFRSVKFKQLLNKNKG